jgi:hypothetical protein
VPGSGRSSGFVCFGGGIAFCIVERFGRWQLDEIGTGSVRRLIAATPETCTRGREESLRNLDQLQRFALGFLLVGGQIFDLLKLETV